MLKIISTFFTIVIVLLCSSCDLEVVEDNLIIENKTFEKFYGGATYNEGYDIISTQEGGYAIVGITNSYGAGAWDIYFLLLDEEGEVLVEKTYGGPLNDKAYSIIQTTNGGFAILGSTKSFGAGEADVYLVLIDKDGNELPTSGKTYGGFYDDEATKIIKNPNGGYAIVGFTKSMGASAPTFPVVYLILIDEDGNELSNSGKIYGDFAADYGYDIIPTQNGGFAIIGTTGSFGNGGGDVYLILTDANGDELSSSEITFGGTGSDVGKSIIQREDGGYTIVGYTRSFGAGDFDVYLIFTDENGVEIPNSSKTFGGTESDVGLDILKTQDGKYVLVGHTRSFGNGDNDIYFIVTDSVGVEISTPEKTFGGESGEIGRSIIETEDGGFAIVGETKSFGAGFENIYFIKTDADGNL